MKELAIKTVELSKTYNMGSNQVEALQSTNLEIEQGKFVALTGTSGSGKSTLLHLLGGLDAPTTGEVFLEGQSLTKCKERQLAEIRRDRIGFVFQKFHLIQELNHMPHELSGGQQQRVAIARALANEAAILLCDEPTGNLDQRTSKEVLALLHDIHEKYHKTILVVTHDPEIAEGADYILKIEDGKILI